MMGGLHMIKNDNEFGTHVYGDKIGKTWISLVDAIVNFGTESYDESRQRLALQNVRVKAQSIDLPDENIERYADKASIEAIIKLTFSEPKMYDIDVVPSFSPGAKSYYERIREGHLLDFVISRLNLIPESKKAAIVFPTYEDYRAVLKNPWDDYLPCIVTVQFRLVECDSEYRLDTTFYARSIDAFQKANGNLVAMAMMSAFVADRLNLNKPVRTGFLDGLIADAHIYQESLLKAKNLITEVNKDRINI